MVAVNRVSSFTNNGKPKPEVSKSNSSRTPPWKTVLRIVLTIVVIAAIVIAGKYLLPKVVEFITTTGKTAASTISTATSAVSTVGAAVEGVEYTFSTAEKVIRTLNKPTIQLAKEAATAAKDWFVSDLGTATKDTIGSVVKGMPFVQILATGIRLNKFVLRNLVKTEHRPQGAW